MNHCKNCKYWNTHPWNDMYQPKGSHKCEYPKPIWNIPNWIETNVRTLNEVDQDALAFSEGCYKAESALYTRAEFGCVAFVEKQQ